MMKPILINLLIALISVTGFSQEAIVNSSGQWNAKIDSSHLPSGMYMIQFINGNTSETMKLIKE